MPDLQHAKTISDAQCEIIQNYLCAKIKYVQRFACGRFQSFG